MKYTVVFERTPSNYSAYVPDLPGCVATGKTRQQTARNIRAAITLHVQGLHAENAPIPKPSAWTETVEAIP